MDVWTQIRNEEPQKAASVNREIIDQLEQQSNFQVVSKYTSSPYDGNLWRGKALIGKALLGSMFSMLLIFIWEIPFLFYSQKTKEMVFVPLKADWQSELIDAKLRNQTWKVFQINIQYSYAFLAAMVQKTPVGSLIEFVSKYAKS